MFDLWHIVLGGYWMASNKSSHSLVPGVEKWCIKKQGIVGLSSQHHQCNIYLINLSIYQSDIAL